MAATKSTTSFNSSSSAAASAAASGYPVANCALVDFVDQCEDALSSLKKSAEKNPTQKAYADTILGALRASGWDRTFLLIQGLCSAEALSAAFAGATVEAALRSLQRVVKGEFDSAYHASFSEMDMDLTELSLGQLIKILRLCVSEIIYRFFRTYDPKDKRMDREAKKEVLLMEAQNATYRMNGHVYADEAFVSFMDQLITAYKQLLTVDFDRLRKTFAEAGAKAKAEREAFFASMAAEKAKAKSDSRRAAGLTKDKPAKPAQTKTAPAGQLKVVAVQAAAVQARAIPPVPAVNPWQKRKEEQAAIAASEAQLAADLVGTTAEPAAEATAEPAAEPAGEPAAEADPTFTVVKGRNQGRNQSRGQGRGQGRRGRARAQATA
jgi:hypothetical protein